MDTSLAIPRNQPIVVSASNGIWGPPVEVPGSAIANDGGDQADGGSQVNAISCWSPGNCVAGGYYLDPVDPNLQRAFLTTERGGSWQAAFQVGRTAAGAYTEIATVSCARAGQCGGGGITAGNQPFVVSTTGGRWGGALIPPGVRRLDHGYGRVTTVSCVEGGCSAGGYFVGAAGAIEGFVDDQVRGSWKPAEQVSATLHGPVLGISCARAGDCSAIGQFISTGSHAADVVINEVGGVWGDPIQLARANVAATYPQLTEVSCGAPGSCSAVGTLYGTSGGLPPVGIFASESPMPMPAVLVCSPDRGSDRGGTTVVIRGRNLADTVAVRFGAREGRLQSVASTRVVVVAPRGAGVVMVRVVAQAGISPGSRGARFSYLARL